MGEGEGEGGSKTGVLQGGGGGAGSGHAKNVGGASGEVVTHSGGVKWWMVG